MQEALNNEQVVIQSATKKNNKQFHRLHRGSTFRGVSKNGKAWQIMMMIDQEKIYLGTMEDPEKAALLYDMAII